MDSPYLRISFNGFYDSNINQDFIRVPANGGMPSFLEKTADSSKEASIKSDLSTISNSMECYWELTTTKSSVPVTVRIFSFGNETALEFEHTPPPVSGFPSYEYVRMYVNDRKVTYAEVTSNSAVVYVDISGCRESGFGVSPDSSKYYEEVCTRFWCSANRSVTFKGCNDWERCSGYGTCYVNKTCTVTGPTVIDFHDTVNSVEDRCAYSLLKDSYSGIEVLANFQERRRKDVSFLDSVTLKSGGSVYHLEQDGRVLEGNTPLNLSSTYLEINGLEFFRDHTGVTVKQIAYGHMFSLFFDGDTVQLNIEASSPSYLDGLCTNSSSFSEARLSQESSSSCDTQYPEPADSSINCTTMTDRCNLLMEAPFSSCNDDVDPAPYITACSDTLCKYPSVDGLRCQFLEAYARACSLNSSTLEEWWSAAQCPPPEDFCQDKMCSDHEFCGEINGNAACLCRAIKASKYRESGTLGDPTVCTQNSASVTLVGCLLEEDNIDYSRLHLNDETCKGEKDEESHMVTFSFNSSNTCGAVITANDSHVVYKNTILSQNTSSDIIVRQDQVSIDFSCTNTQPEVKTVAFRIKDSSVVQKMKSGAWNYTLTMKAYTDAGRTQVVDSNTDVLLNQKIWVELETDGLDEDLVAVVTDSCWATSQESSSSTPRYDLIQNGCPNTADQTVEVEGNGEGTFNYLSFNMFQFSGSSAEVYLHCKLELCVKQNNICIPDCSGRGRRSVRSKYRRGRGASALISMAWIH